MVKAVTIPVTVKMRKGWDDKALNAGDVARRVQDAGAAAIAIHGRTAKQSYTGIADWDIVAWIASSLSIPVFGSGDCVEPQQIVDRLRLGVSGVFVGRGVLRNPWILAQAQDMLEGRSPRQISMEQRGRFLLEYIDLLLNERADEAAGFRHLRIRRLGTSARWHALKSRSLGDQQTPCTLHLVYERALRTARICG